MTINPLLFGGRSLVGPFLIRRLEEKGLTPTVFSRKGGEGKVALDLASPGSWRAPKGAPVLSLLPLWICAENLALFEGASRLVAVSSTSRFGKAASSDPAERATAEKLARAEDQIMAWAVQQGVPTTLLRPTLIYDEKTDQNVTRMARFIQRFGLLPVAAPAKGLRQPIHADDVAAAIVAALSCPRSAGQSFNIAGGEVLTYRTMAARVFEGLGKPPRFLALPVGFLEKLYRLLTLTGLFAAKGQGFGAFRRMNEDLVFEVEEGIKTLALSPRAFHPGFNDL